MPENKGDSVSGGMNADAGKKKSQKPGGDSQAAFAGKTVSVCNDVKQKREKQTQTAWRRFVSANLEKYCVEA